MRNPRRIRVTERRFLNLPGYHGGAYVLAYVEDTTDRASANGAGPCPAPQVDFEIGDGDGRVVLHFGLATAAERLNAFHKVDALIETLVRFRAGLAAEADLQVERRARVEGRASGPAAPAAAPRRGRGTNRVTFGARARSTCI